MRAFAVGRRPFALAHDRIEGGERGLGADDRLRAAQVDLRRGQLQRRIAAERRLLADSLDDTALTLSPSDA